MGVGYGPLEESAAPIGAYSLYEIVSVSFLIQSGPRLMGGTVRDRAVRPYLAEAGAVVTKAKLMGIAGGGVWWPPARPKRRDALSFQFSVLPTG
jgi:hypothetical protein